MQGSRVNLTNPNRAKRSWADDLVSSFGNVACYDEPIPASGFMHGKATSPLPSPLSVIPRPVHYFCAQRGSHLFVPLPQQTVPTAGTTQLRTGLLPLLQPPQSHLVPAQLHGLPFAFGQVKLFPTDCPGHIGLSRCGFY